MRLNIQKFGGRGASSSSSKIAIMNENEASKYKLTAEQLKQYNDAVKDLNIKLNSKDAKDYYIKREISRYDSKENYEARVQREGETYDRNAKYMEGFEEGVKNSLNEGKTKNVVTSRMSSSTLRALEKKGLIKIIRVGGYNTDKFELLKRK